MPSTKTTAAARLLADFITRDLRGTGPRGTVRDDRLVADRDNKMAIKPRRKR